MISENKYSVYYLEDTCYCDISFDMSETGYLSLDFQFSSVFLGDFSFSDFQEMVERCDLCKDEMYYVASHMDEVAPNTNWMIRLGGRMFLCCRTGTEEPMIDLGKLGECYDDCDECDRYCYSFKNDSPYEHKYDCPRYTQCADVYGTIYNEWGEEEDFDTLWDFRCQCTKINGRESLETALKEQKTYSWWSE